MSRRLGPRLAAGRGLVEFVERDETGHAGDQQAGRKDCQNTRRQLPSDEKKRVNITYRDGSEDKKDVDRRMYPLAYQSSRKRHSQSEYLPLWLRWLKGRIVMKGSGIKNRVWETNSISKKSRPRQSTLT